MTDDVLRFRALPDLTLGLPTSAAMRDQMRPTSGSIAPN